MERVKMKTGFSVKEKISLFWNNRAYFCGELKGRILHPFIWQVFFQCLYVVFNRLNRFTFADDEIEWSGTTDVFMYWHSAFRGIFDCVTNCFAHQTARCA
jgi:hypothetical protein